MRTTLQRVGGRARPAAAVAFLFAVVTALPAQMLQNGDFEAWTGSTPVDWNLLWPSNMTSRSTTSVHCGTASCQVDVVGNWSEVGKQMSFVTPPTGVLRARLRVLYPPAAQQPSGSNTGTLTLNLAGFVNGVWTPVPGSSLATIQPSPHWQEVALAFVPGSSPTANLVRCYATFANGNGQRYFLDSVDFAGSAAVYGALQPSAARQVRSSALSLIFDDTAGVKRLRELRRVDGLGNATGPNYLDTSGAPAGSLLYAGNTRPSVASGSTGFDSAAHALAVTAITPTPANPRTGWRFVGGDANVAVDLAIYSETGRSELFIDPLVTPNNRMLEEFTCPVLKFRPYLDPAAAASQLVVPNGGGAVLRLDPSAFAHVAGLPNAQDWIGGEYPGGAALQMLALYTDTEGVALMAQDGAGENKQLTAILSATTPRVELRITHRLPSVQASTPVATFRRALVPCVGDWRHGADQYRDWVRTTALWAQAASRPTAGWIDERPTLFEADLMPQGIGEDLVPIDDWDKLMDDWRSALGSGPGTGTMVPLFRSFENQGTYIGPNYLPLQVLDVGPTGVPYQTRHDQAAILSSWSEVHNDGGRPMAMVAGLNWAWQRLGTQPLAAGGCSSGSSSYWQYSYNWATSPPAGTVVLTRNGQPYFRPLNPSGASWEYSHFVMDPRHGLAVSTHMGLARTMASGGMDLYLFDQMNGGGVPDNFSTMFGHPGAGPWKGGAIRNLFASTLVAGRAVNPDFELSIEDPCELSLDLIAVQGFRADQMLRHPGRDYAQSEAIPLFPYVFHEVCSFVNWDIGGMLSDWVAVQPWAATLASRSRQFTAAEWARTLTAGCWLGTSIAAWTLISEYQTASGGTLPCSVGVGQTLVPWAARADSALMPFLQACVATSQGPARSFLNDGKMVRSAGMSWSGTVPVAIEPWNAVSPIFTHPAICESTWEMTPSYHAVLLANIDLSNTVNVTLPNRIGARAVMPGDLLKVHTNGGQAVPLAYTPGLAVPVPAASVVFITL